jgi:hypothetical protein
MINWTYNAKDFKINENTLIPEGDHRVVITGVKIKTYSSGNDGFEIMLDVSGYSSRLWHRIIMDPSNPEKTNHHLGKFFESFGITNFDLNRYDEWIGKDGAVRVKHDDYCGSVSAKVIFCITRAYQDKLPAWGQPAVTKTYDFLASNQVFKPDSVVKASRSSNWTPPMPNEYAPSSASTMERKFDGFKF